MGKKIKRKHDVCVHGLVSSIDFLFDCYRRLLFCYVSIGWVQVCLFNREPFYRLSYIVQNSNCCRPISIWILFQSFFSHIHWKICSYIHIVYIRSVLVWIFIDVDIGQKTEKASTRSFLPFLLLLTFLLKHFWKQFTMPTANI